MTEFTEIFNPGARFQRQQQDLEKSLIVEAEYGGDGPKPLDLDSGAVQIVMRATPPTGATGTGDHNRSVQQEPTQQADHHGSDPDREEGR